jgi:hypothetical protein
MRSWSERLEPRGWKATFKRHLNWQFAAPLQFGSESNLAIDKSAGFFRFGLGRSSQGIELDFGYAEDRVDPGIE